ncbi:DUF4468 domain-containing protein [Mucilaginibacter sp. FT3.2]|uniref:DUF4468 domain-containing protein n=1 Tax=Mucilaginibacter sp. FT3.2 TaxID=2723090 RepID=UPI001607AE16|nr:DUF4468 domain-containing protein [Mucilaginibacter sp. FT3.2]MBB6230345.1 hypothetical protein [Mucilaginibacter sp. FT3.2]
MKKLLVLTFIIFAKSAFAQKDTVGLNVPFVNNTVAYERVFDVPNAPKNLLYSNAGLWLAETHPYVENTQLQLNDPVLSRVVGRVKSSTRVATDKVLWQTYYDTITYNFTLQVDCKDNKYRIRIYNIQYVLGADYASVDDLMLALINSKSYTLTKGAVLKTPDLKQCFQALNIAVDNVLADITKSIVVDNSF